MKHLFPRACLQPCLLYFFLYVSYVPLNMAFNMSFLCVFIPLFLFPYPLSLAAATTPEAGTRGPGWLRLSRAGGCSRWVRACWKWMGLAPGSSQLPPHRHPVLLPKPCCLHPILLANMIAFEGMWFATEAMLSRLLNLHIPALRRTSENRERWKEFGRAGEKTWRRCLQRGLGCGTGQARVPLQGGNLKGRPVEGAQLHLGPRKRIGRSCTRSVPTWKGQRNGVACDIG